MGVGRRERLPARVPATLVRRKIMPSREEKSMRSGPLESISSTHARGVSLFQYSNGTARRVPKSNRLDVGDP